MSLTPEVETEIRKRLKSPYSFLSREMQEDLLREIEQLRITSQGLLEENATLRRDNVRLTRENSRLLDELA